MLKKDNAFLFVSGVQSKSPSGIMVNGYLLEFDNGRNILVSGEIANLDVLRPFLYGLRDEGKEIHMVFLYNGAMNETTAAEILALFQPRLGVLFSGVSGQKFSNELFQQSLKDQLFEGSVLTAKAGDVFPF
jgi:hypothetical protein